ncbi:MAG: TatD family hydrolase [Microcoleus sp. SIO2G3]|nr:TatD family hydrolase [Microcoleus sp. SIO2G3]
MSIRYHNPTPLPIRQFAKITAFVETFYGTSLLHPLDVDQWTDATTAEILALAQSDPKVVAIGETGLDFFKAENQARQQDAFAAQLAIAQQLSLPVIVHCRDAAATAIDMLRERPDSRGVMHCWSGTPEETRWFVDRGFYISFSGIVTFKNAIEVQESAKLVPDDRLLIETDCPFLSPVPKRKERRNQPANVIHVAEQLARLRNVEVEAIATQTTVNARQLFGLPEIA